MIKTLKLREGCEITLTNDSLWMEEYKDQFGRDVLPMIMPLIIGISQTIGVLAEEAEGFDKIDEKVIYRLLGSDSMLEIGIKISGLEITDIHRIMWAMAKAYDENIEDPKAWLRKLAGPEHEAIPLFDVILPAIAELAVKGVISPKNWERLTANMETIKKKLQPKTKTKKKSQ